MHTSSFDFFSRFYYAAHFTPPTVRTKSKSPKILVLTKFESILKRLFFNAFCSTWQRASDFLCQTFEQGRASFCSIQHVRKFKSKHRHLFIHIFTFAESILDRFGTYNQHLFLQTMKAKGLERSWPNMFYTIVMKMKSNIEQLAGILNSTLKNKMIDQISNELSFVNLWRTFRK